MVRLDARAGHEELVARPVGAVVGCRGRVRGRKPTGVDAIAWAERMAANGAGEILLTSMDRDGTGDGFDIPLTRAVSTAVRVPVIASGGAGWTVREKNGACAPSVPSTGCASTSSR